MGVYNLFNYYSSPFLTEDNSTITREDDYQIIVEDPGAGTLWGVDPDDDRMLWLFQVDWDGDGTLDLDNEAPLITNASIDRGRDYLLNAASTGFEPVRPGKMVLTLENKDNRFDPYNTASPLYPNVTPGKLCQLSAKIISENVKRVRFTGYIEDIRPISGTDQVQITAVDKIRRYKNKNVTLALEQDIQVNEAIEAILEAIGDTDYDIDNTLDQIAYYWVDSKRAMSAITELTDVSIGLFFVAADGTTKFYQRNKSDVAALELDQSEMHRQIEVNQPWDDIRNYIELTINPRTLVASGDIWTLGDKPLISAGGSIEIWGQFTYANEQVPAINVVDPVATTDYTMNTEADGTGVNLTASFSVTADVFSQAIKLTVTNNSSSAGYITLLKCRGEAIAKTNTARLVHDDGADDPQFFTLDSPWLQNTNLAEDLLEDMKDYMVDARRSPIVILEDQREKQLLLDLFDRVDVTIAQLGITAPYRIGNIREEWLAENGQAIQTTLRLEPIVNIITGDVWQFTTQLGVTSRFS